MLSSYGMDFRKTNLFYYLRHGQTDPNVTDTTCGGDWDVPLKAKRQLFAGAIHHNMR